MPRIEIREFQTPALKNPVVIEGFPGIGMVGTIAASYLANKLDMTLVGYIASTHFPPVAAIHDYKPVSPARIYASEKHDLLVLFSEFVIPMEVVFPLSEKIIEWAKGHNARAIYSLAGIASPQPEEKIYGIASTPDVARTLQAAGIELVKEGATQGVSGVLIAECAVQKFPAANLMIQTAQPLDPRGTAKLLDKLAAMLRLDLDTAPLVKEGKQVEENMKDAIEKMKALGKNYKDLEKNPMYG